jgi:hypothetical protein
MYVSIFIIYGIRQNRTLQENPVIAAPLTDISVGYSPPFRGLFGSCKLHVCTITPHVADQPFV